MAGYHPVAGVLATPGSIDLDSFLQHLLLLIGSARHRIFCMEWFFFAGPVSPIASSVPLYL